MKRFSLGIILCSALLSTSAAAQGMSLGSSSSAKSTGAYFPVWGVELRVFSYRPVLTNYPKAIAVRKTFDKGNSSFFAQNPLGASLEFNWYPLQVFGLLGGYARAGFWHGSTPTRQCTDPSTGKIINCTPITVLQSEQGSDSQSINIVPISVGVMYRFDMLRRNLGLPIVFTAKWGLDYNVWWATLGVGNAHAPNGDRAIGGILGWTGSVSVGYSFDASGKNAAGLTYGKRRDTQETYLFLEYNIVNGRALFLPDTVVKPRVDLSDAAVIAIGMALEFN